MGHTGKKSLQKKKKKKKSPVRKGRKLKGLDEKSIEILPMIEYAIYEVDKVFKNQGDKLTDGYLVSSLKDLAHMIKSKSFETIFQEVRDELTEDADVIHWNIISRIGEHIEGSELNYSSRDIVNAIEGLIETIKLQMSKENPRAYLSFLSEIMRGVEMKTNRDIELPSDEDDYFDEENY